MLVSMYARISLDFLYFVTRIKALKNATCLVQRMGSGRISLKVSVPGGIPPPGVYVFCYNGRVHH